MPYLQATINLAGSFTPRSVFTFHSYVKEFVTTLLSPRLPAALGSEELLPSSPNLLA